MSRADCRPSHPLVHPQQAPSPQSSLAAVTQNAARRRMKHGPVRPMQEPTWVERLLGRR